MSVSILAKCKEFTEFWRDRLHELYEIEKSMPPLKGDELVPEIKRAFCVASFFVEQEEQEKDRFFTDTKFFRLKPDGEVRLMGGYIIKCGEIEKDADGRKVKGTIHWLSAKYAKPTTLMLYDRLFNIENTADVPEGKTYLDFLNENSLTKIEGAMVEPSLSDAKPGEKFQFVRFGYFCKDTHYENTFNQVVSLKDAFAKK